MFNAIDGEETLKIHSNMGFLYDIVDKNTRTRPVEKRTSAGLSYL
jgi:hypothetical protein